MPLVGRRKGGASNGYIVYSGDSCIVICVSFMGTEKVTIQNETKKHILLRKGDVYYEEQQF